jgi:hypothetical protein
MGKKKPKHRKEDNSSPFDKARDELLSHILHCGVLQAEVQHQKDWFDDTMEYMAERYGSLSRTELTTIRTLGERYCRPVKRHDSEEVGAPS